MADSRGGTVRRDGATLVQYTAITPRRSSTSIDADRGTFHDREQPRAVKRLASAPAAAAAGVSAALALTPALPASCAIVSVPGWTTSCVVRAGIARMDRDIGRTRRLVP